MIKAGIFLFAATALAASVGALMVTATPGRLDRMVVATLENRFSRPDLTSLGTPTGIIALAGDDARFKEAGRLARLYPDARVLLSDKTTMAGALAQLGGGVDPARIELETKSRNTYEDARFCANLAKPTAQQWWLLVTSAVHMSRALASFRAAGFDVEPWPVYDDGLPATVKFTQAIHEWLGLLVYRALGRTDRLLPKSPAA